MHTHTHHNTHTPQHNTHTQPTNRALHCARTHTRTHACTRTQLAHAHHALLSHTNSQINPQHNPCHNTKACMHTHTHTPTPTGLLISEEHANSLGRHVGQEKERQPPAARPDAAETLPNARRRAEGSGDEQGESAQPSAVLWTTESERAKERKSNKAGCWSAVARQRK
ncbi:hypothetical protein FI667_g9111, partial [Globisporangium splendens]